MNKYSSMVVGAGTRLQSGIPKQPATYTPERANGLLLRGVVVATYVTDDGLHPFAEAEDGTPAAVYCDVLCTYKQKPFLIPTVLVSQERTGMHSSRIWKPRAAKLDVTESSMDLDKSTNPANIDGDHVLVGFLDDNLNQPVILKALPHPSADIGNEDKDVGLRTRLKLADGDPDLVRHKGSYYGIDTYGNFLIDLTKAYVDDDFQSDGKEPDIAEDGSAGNYQVRLMKGSTLTVIIEEGATLTVEDKEANATMTLGDGAKSAAVSEPLETLYGDLKTQLDIFKNHTHPTGTGPSGTPTPPVTWPPWDGTIQSDRLKIPG